MVEQLSDVVIVTWFFNFGFWRLGNAYNYFFPAKVCWCPAGSGASVSSDDISIWSRWCKHQKTWRRMIFRMLFEQMERLEPQSLRIYSVWITVSLEMDGFDWGGSMAGGYPPLESKDRDYIFKVLDAFQFPICQFILKPNLIPDYALFFKCASKKPAPFNTSTTWKNPSKPAPFNTITNPLENTLPKKTSPSNMAGALGEGFKGSASQADGFIVAAPYPRRAQIRRGWFSPKTPVEVKGRGHLFYKGNLVTTKSVEILKRIQYIVGRSLS